MAAPVLPQPPTASPPSGPNRLSRSGATGRVRENRHSAIGVSPVTKRPDPGRGGKYAHFKDLMSRAVPEVERDDALNIQLKKAEDYISSSKRLVEYKRIDLAYIDYIRGYEITVNYIPGHKDYSFYCNTMKSWESRMTELMKTVFGMEGMMVEIKHMIEEDNTQSGVQPTLDPVLDTKNIQAHQAPESTDAARPISLYGKPTIRPKPEALHGHVVPAASVADDLSQRFNRLRTPPNGPAIPSRSDTITVPTPSNFSSSHTSVRPQSYSTQSSTFNPPRNGTPHLIKPTGPRDMPSAPHGPMLPPKIPLTPIVASLPRAPSPAYSPAKTAGTPSIPNPPRTSTDNNASFFGRQTYYNSSGPTPYPSHQVQRARDDNLNPYRPRTPNGVNSAMITKSNSYDIPSEPAITAEQLMAYIRQYNVLLIDVRSRDHFDDGHIFSKSILCIEPVALKEGVSAEELEERLIVSPDAELSIFEKRNEFDLVVYYDQGTASTKYLVGPPTGSNTPALRALYDTLYEFNDYKPLKDGRPPALLLGGLDAWVELMGPQSLVKSKTAALMGSTRTRKPVKGTGRPLGRHRMASVNSSSEVRKRRLRAFQPLDPEEERAWRAKAHAEEVDSAEYAQSPIDTDPSELDAVEEEPTSPFIRDHEDFFRRFPDVQGLQQSMVRPSQPPPPLPPAQFDHPSMPSVPSRPAPAVPRPSYSGLSDTHQAQAPLARQTSATRPPLHPSNSVVRRMRLPRTGLTNFGATCYMNSTIQCLNATIPMASFFIDDRYRHFIQKNWKGSQGIMPGLYSNLVRSLWKGDVEVIKPTSFRNFLGRMNQEWASNRQQDAKEYFDFLIDCLHEDLNINWERTPLRPLTFEEEMIRERFPIPKASRIEWDRWTHRENSFISELFAGQHASRLRCTTCGNTSTTYEAFYSISVEIPRQGVGDIRQCLQSYCQEELLSGDEVWKCPHCKCEREATKRIILTRAPQFLVIHFKRFSASKSESARKVHTPIDFPLYGLSMDPYMIPHPVPSLTGAQDGERKTDPAITAPYSYDCYGVLRHLGSSGNSGHYISLVKDSSRNTWRKFDDERPTDFNPAKLHFKDRLQNEQAYIVFFQRSAAR